MTRKIASVNLVLLLAIIILANLVSTNAFFRLDLTSSGAYRLSGVTRETLSRLEDPLRIEVFYSGQVPAPYNSVRQYLLDLLREYTSRDRRRITVEVVDTASPEGRQAATQYGLQQVEIQEIRSDEFQSRAVFLGAVVLYGSTVEVVDRITSTEGLEYRLTQAIRSAVTASDTLAGISEPVRMVGAISPEIAELGIDGFDRLPRELEEIHQRINRDSYDRITWELLQPSLSEVAEVATQLGMRPLRWQGSDGAERSGLLELAITLGDRTQLVPLQIYSGFFGGYSLDEPQQIEEDLRQALRTLVAANPTVGYLTGAGERPLRDFQRTGAGPFAQLLDERYEVLQIDPAEEPIPTGMDTLVINGPRQQYSELALYRLDQFLLGGGSLLVFLDRYFERIPTQQEMMFGAQPEWQQVLTGLEELLAHHGVTVTGEFVLDEESFIARSAQGQQRVFQAPLLSGASFNRDSVITSALEEMILFNMTEIRDTSSDPVTVTPLLQTSSRSWTVEFPQEIGPWTQGPPPGETTGARTVAVIASGGFESFFDGPVSDQTDPAAATPLEGPAVVTRFRRTAAPGGQLLVVSSSEVTSPQLLDGQNRTPNGTFLMNAVDVLKGAPGFAELRSKGLGVPRLEVSSPAVPAFARLANVVAVPALVILIGVAVWLRRRAHSREIQHIFRETSQEER